MGRIPSHPEQGRGRRRVQVLLADEEQARLTIDNASLVDYAPIFEHREIDPSQTGVESGAPDDIPDLEDPPIVEPGSAVLDPDGAGDPPPRPKAPVMSRVLVRDVTIERLASLLADNPRGLLRETGELATMLGGLERYSSRAAVETGYYLEMYHADPLTVDRIGDPRRGGPPTIIVPRAHVCIVGTIQPGVLRRCLGAEVGDRDRLGR